LSSSCRSATDGAFSAKLIPDGGREAVIPNPKGDPGLAGTMTANESGFQRPSISKLPPPCAIVLYGSFCRPFVPKF
jgi:hypothetical protein